ncbi:MAG: heat-shock protein [Chitinophagia bacterium]|nr:heat-shock protein [Chitinophagia bacterium]
MTTLLPTMFKDFDKFFVGFDDTYNRLAKLHDDVTKYVPNYPPYNIKKVEENKYVVELAVAGFAKQDIEITFEDGKLIVKGSTQDDGDNFLFRGIANRAFTRTFALDDQIEIKDAEMFNGMLKIFLERIVPEHKKPKKIEVKEKSTSAKQLLVEDKDVK